MYIWLPPEDRQFLSCKIPFGKHRGRVYCFLPPDYIRWLIQHSMIKEAKNIDRLKRYYHDICCPKIKPIVI